MKPPFRADQVGSLLRPRALSDAKNNGLPKEKILEIQHGAIREAVAKQEAIGLEAVTDGEFSRDWWHLDFLSRLEGVALRENPGVKFGGTQQQPMIPTVTAKVRYSRPVMVEDFAFLKSVTNKTAKFTIPSPSMLPLRGGRAASRASCIRRWTTSGMMRRSRTR